MNELMPNELSLKITHLRAQNNGSEIAVTVVLENGEESECRVLVLSMQDYCSIKPVKGPLSEEQFETMQTAASRYAALRCGVNLLSYGSNPSGTLVQKIIRHGFSKSEAQETVKNLARTGVLNETADLEREVERCLRKLWGERRIRAQLWTKGYSEESLLDLPTLLEKADFVSNCAALIRKKYGGIPSDPAERRKMCASLYRYGYSTEEIRKALQIIQRQG